MTKKEYVDPKYGYLLVDHRFCKVCGAPLTYEERMQTTCNNCLKRRQLEKHQRETQRAFNSIISNDISKSIPMAETNNPIPASSVELLDDKGQEELYKNMKQLSTIHDVLACAPDRAVVFVHIENYSPVINNYYSNTEDTN
jgi:predicted nucleic acid-binding Zn ribbon protein